MIYCFSMKAYMRSRLWQHERWSEDQYNVQLGPYFAKSANEIAAVNAKVDEHYREIQESVDGKRAEPGVG